MSCRPGHPLSNNGHSELKTHALLAGSYIQLQLENWLTAIEYAELVIEKEVDYDSNNYYLCWLCYTYQASAYMSSGNTKRATEILKKAMALVLNKEHLEAWQNRLHDFTGISTVTGVGVDGGRLALENLSKYGTLSGQASIISDINEWRLLNYTNLAAAYCLQGKISQSISILEQAGKLLNYQYQKNHKRSHDPDKNHGDGQENKSSFQRNLKPGNSLGQQQYDSVRCYIGETLDNGG